METVLITVTDRNESFGVNALLNTMGEVAVVDGNGAFITMSPMAAVVLSRQLYDAAVAARDALNAAIEGG